MSGWSGSQDCPKCGGEDSLKTFGDYKPINIVAGECLECGFEYHTIEGQMGLEEVNWKRKYDDLEPLTQLKTQIIEGGDQLKYKVTGQAKYEYEVEAEDKEMAIEKALELFHEQTFQTWGDMLEWEAKEVKKEKGGD